MYNKNFKTIVLFIEIMILLFVINIRLWSESDKEIDECIKELTENQKISISFVSKVKVESYIKDKKDRKIVMETFVNGLENSIARYLSPKIDRGKTILMKKNNYWFYFPRTRQSIRISPRQRLLGQANIGDIVKPPLLETYDIQLADKREDDDTIYIFRLKAKTSKAPYQILKIHFSKKKQYIFYQEFYTRNKILLKKAYYSNVKWINNKPFVRNIKIVDGMDDSKYSIVVFQDIKIKKLNPNLFQLKSIPHINYEY
ncbi:MAG: outer membrane lipoprotein-sorting protein [Atribacterota bacterium]